MTPSAALSPELERLARKRVNARLGFYTHALVYILVVGGLGLLALSQGRAWAFWPAAGWGIGLLMHGLGVFGFGPGSALRDTMLERERELLRQRA
jgi:uncharacterized membrane protein